MPYRTSRRLTVIRKHKPYDTVLKRYIAELQPRTAIAMELVEDLAFARHHMNDAKASGPMGAASYHDFASLFCATLTAYQKLDQGWDTPPAAEVVPIRAFRPEAAA
jgi:hypothetical protein